MYIEERGFHNGEVVSKQV